MKRLVTLFTLALLAACGADGPPVAPSQAPAPAPTSGIAITGEAEIGVRGEI
jgi:predicted small lipoprotein YifL